MNFMWSRIYHFQRKNSQNFLSLAVISYRNNGKYYIILLTSNCENLFILKTYLSFKYCDIDIVILKMLRYY